ncbi:MAG: flagellar FlbD family protein [Acidimicrobiia bacterium]|nr:flagellar FlbD family protein [Acidimicrobiia bacterium]
MIVFTRLNRTEIGLNPDQIQRVESTPDTVITLNDEKRFLVLESMDEVVRRIVEYRAYVLALANTIDVSEAARPALHLVPGDSDPARHEDR